MSFFSRNLTFKHIISLSSVAILGGCASSYPMIDPLAKAVPAKVIKIDGEYNLWGGNYWSNRFMTTVYTVVDGKGRSFRVKEPGSAANAQFKVGECVSLWRASTVLNTYYPRINSATSDCRVIAPEPEKAHYYHYQLDQESVFNRKLDSWLDVDYPRLIENWGEPNQKYYENDRLVLRYREEYRAVEQYSTLRFGYGTTIANDYVCDIKFYVDADKLVRGYSWQGNHCY